MKTQPRRHGWPAAALALVAHSLGAAPTTVPTFSGTLQGYAEDRGVNAYLGIPYAQPPIGSLRWQPPQRPSSWSGVKEVKRFGASCFQPLPPPKFGPYTAEFVDFSTRSEDCLFLNVWAPAAHEKRLPVLFWIHGGGFLGGSSEVAIYNGHYLATRHAIVVSVNYRVGPFGFLALPELTAESTAGSSGNYGLLDIIAALQWVHQNIAQFGGDPGNVTVAGQSAGAVVVNSLLLAPAARGLFSHAIAESGSGMGLSLPTLRTAEVDGQRMAQWLGAPNLTELRALSPEKIQSAVFLPIGPPSSASPPAVNFRPVVDGRILADDPDNGSARAQSPVPMITGFNLDEAYDPTHLPSKSVFERNVRDRYGDHADRFLALYPHATDPEAAQSQRVLNRDRYMSSLILWSQKRAEVNQQRIYTYLFRHTVPTRQPPDWGTFHTAEVPYVFHVLNRHDRPYTEDDDRIAAQLSDYWLEFMRTGDPNDHRLPRWEPAGAVGMAVMGLGDTAGMLPAVSSSERYEAFRDFVRDGGQLSLF